MNVIEANLLVKSYGDIRAVDGLTFGVERGGIFGLLGPNGAGKTTTIECLTGLQEPDAGELRVLGLHPGRDRKELFRRIGVQLQETSYQNRIRVEEICRLFASFYEKPASCEELLGRFGLLGKKRAFVGGLSGGQRQRLSIILALLPRPEIVFLDELTTGLDPEARRGMWELVRGLKAGGVTVCMTTHYMEEAEYLCDKVCIVRQGKLVTIGTVAEVIAAGGLESEIAFETDQALPDDLAGTLPSSSRLRREGTRYTLRGREDTLLGKLTYRLESAHVPYRNLCIRKPTLEDAYLQLTGTSREETKI